MRADLQAWPNTNSAAAWTSMVTGCNPGKHGIFGFGDDPRRVGDSWRPTTGDDRRRAPFWQTLSDAGQTVGVLNVPITFPVDEINGFMIAGMDAPSVASSGFARPADILAELHSAGIEYAIDVPDLGRLSRADPGRALAMAEQVVTARGRTMLHLMRTRPWDLLMSVFTTTDRVQHYFWPPGAEKPGGREWEPILRIYTLIDDFIGRALDLIDADTNVVVVSDHGFGPWREARHALNQLLAALGLMSYRPSGPTWRARVLSGMLSQGRRYIPAMMQRRLAMAFPRLRLRAVSEQRYSGLDWPRTRVFANNHGSRIFVNLAGREARGTVPASEYDATVERTCEIVASLRDADTRSPVVRRVWRRDDLYNGPYRDRTADMLVEWEHRHLGDRLLFQAGEGEVVVGEPGSRARHSKWTGEHRPKGVLLARGPGFRKAATIGEANLYDIAATILYCQDQPLPAHMDGRVLEDAFTAGRLAANPVRWSCREGAAPDTGRRLRAADSVAIKNRLRSLGYIE